MANYTDSKVVFAQQMIAEARSILILADQLDNLNASYSVHGFESGGANQFVDADFNAQNTQLTAAIVADVMFAIGNIVGALPTGIRNSLRECLPGGLP